jgi:23S rRNA U2552 (ribose-2'-O)-methylase RlmE/FtsJ
MLHSRRWAAYDLAMKVRPLSVISRIDSIENHCFFPHALSAGALVIDLGANQGHFSRTISRRYGLRCIGVEANPALAREASGPAAEQWR